MEIADIIEQIIKDERFNDYIKKLIASEKDSLRIAANDRKGVSRRELYK